MSITQRTRSLGITTHLGPDTLVLLSMSGDEELGRLFQFDLELGSENHDIPLDALIGQPVCIWVTSREGHKRYFHGHINRFVYAGQHHRLARYRATLVPWAWLLTRSQDCRIFQHQTVVEIIHDVCEQLGFTDIKLHLTQNYSKREFCVQYCETDFDFISRLMEEEGIYFFFKHFSDKHELILCDSPAAHVTYPNYECIVFRPPEDDAVRDQCVYQWSVENHLQSGYFLSNDYDFQAPNKSLWTINSVSDVPRHPHAHYMVYEYPGAYSQYTDGEQQVKLRLEELHAQRSLVKGESDARGLSVGYLFNLAEHPRKDQNREYLLLRVHYELISDEFQTLDWMKTDQVYVCRFDAIDSRKCYRPQRSTPRPLIRGPQTAVVVGPRNQEIWTDKYGRVKVQFHWDHQGKHDEQSSCWIRVSQSHAGRRFGGIDIPRIGEEVIVEFLEGDPNRPIITGRVYNGRNMPPFALPEGGMVSGLKSNSTPGGGGYNEISLNDTKGQEGVHIHAQHNHTLDVGNDRKTNIGNDSVETIGNNVSQSVANNANESVGVNKTLTVGSNLTINAETSITLQCGASVLRMNQAGVITLSGTLVSVQGAINTTVSAPITLVTGSLLLNNSGIINSSTGAYTTVTGTSTTVSSLGDTVVTGTMVKIGD